MVLEYKPVKYYKKFKRDYLQFVVFVKCGAFYYTGSKNVSEYYTDKQSQYMKIRARAKAHVRATISGVQ